MKLRGLYSIVLLACIGQIKCGHEESVELADCEIIPLSTYTCKDEDPSFDFSSNLRYINDEGDKVLDFEITVDEQLSRDIQLVIKIDQWKDGDWDEDVYNGEGSLCKHLEDYAEQAWQRLLQKVEPPVEEACGWPTGSFKVKDLTISPDNFSIPVSMYGRFRIMVKIFNPDGDLLLCHVLETEVNKK